jgi:hypothetical protein
MNEKALAIVNSITITLIIDENGRELIPIRPICDALGVDYSTQEQKIKEDEDLGPTVGLRPTVAADGKRREMLCLPFEFIFGWLFTISPKNVKEEARATVRKYRAQCYRALYLYFSAYSRYMQDRQKKIDEKIIAYDQVRKEFREAQKKLGQAKAELYQVKDWTFEEWKEQQPEQPGNAM